MRDCGGRKVPEKTPMMGSALHADAMTGRGAERKRGVNTNRAPSMIPGWHSQSWQVSEQGQGPECSQWDCATSGLQPPSWQGSPVRAPASASRQGQGVSPALAAADAPPPKGPASSEISTRQWVVLRSVVMKCRMLTMKL